VNDLVTATLLGGDARTSCDSCRPVLERIEFAVRHAAAQIPVPPLNYGLMDLWSDFWTNPGGVSAVGGTVEVGGDKVPRSCSHHTCYCSALKDAMHHTVESLPPPGELLRGWR